MAMELFRCWESLLIVSFKFLAVAVLVVVVLFIVCVEETPFLDI